MPKRKDSEFGKGFVYSLVLFAKHFERAAEYKSTWAEMHKSSPKNFKEEGAYGLWFNGAGDHFFELTIPAKFAKTPIGKLATSLRKRALGYRLLVPCTENEFLVFFDDLEKLTRLIDKALGVEAVKATWN